MYITLANQSMFFCVFLHSVDRENPVMTYLVLYFTIEKLLKLRKSSLTNGFSAAIPVISWSMLPNAVKDSLPEAEWKRSFADSCCPAFRELYAGTLCVYVPSLTTV